MKIKKTYRGMSSFICCILCSGTVNGLEIRSYDPTRHDRFIGFPDNPVFNETAWFDSHKFTGVGWATDGWSSRQYVLVSPWHILCATHIVAGGGTPMRFMGANGNILDRTVASSATVVPTGGLPTDLTLSTLSQPILPSDGVSVMPYLNLPGEINYYGKGLVVFGWNAKAGYGKISTQFLDNHPQNVTGTISRTFRFDYRITPNGSSTTDDAYCVGGDSGSPSFVLNDGKPAVVGLHYLAASSTVSRFTHDTFIPHYISELNALMAPTGYRMTPAILTPVTLEPSIVRTPSNFVTGQAAAARFDIKNASSDLTGNLTLAIRFPAGAGPDSITAPDWVAESTGPDEWQLRKATLSGNTTVSATANWASFPARASLYVKVSYGSDGAAVKTHYKDLAPAATYAAWATHFSDPSLTADSDDDGVSNLFEYAFGGDPQLTTAKTVTGDALLPVISVVSGQWHMSYPVRLDSAARGLEYELEYSPAMETGTWTTTPPEGILIQTTAFEPDLEGFQQRTVDFGIGSMPNFFARVRVKITE